MGLFLLSACLGVSRRSISLSFHLSYVSVAVRSLQTIHSSCRIKTRFPPNICHALRLAHIPLRQPHHAWDPLLPRRCNRYDPSASSSILRLRVSSSDFFTDTSAQISHEQQALT